MKKALADFFAGKDVQGAKEYFLKCFEKRPDILMEASDITGELRICMQIISTCEFEQKFLGSCILDKERDIKKLVPLFKKLNTTVLRKSRGEETVEDRELLGGGLISEPAVEVAMRVMKVGEII